jgi:hypothetical protein
MSLQRQIDLAYTRNVAAEIALRRLLAKTRAAVQAAKVAS